MNKTYMKTTRRNFPNLTKVAGKVRTSAYNIKLQMKN